MIRASMGHSQPGRETMRAAWVSIAIAALALGCRTLPPQPSESSSREPVAPAGERAEEPIPEPPAPPAPPALRSEGLLVTATAYNSLPEQGVGAGQHGAWGDRLEPGMRTIAVSHDL